MFGRSSVPCSPARTSDPWKPAWRSSRRWKARQQQHRPVVLSQQCPPLLVQQLSLASAPDTYDGELLEAPGLLDVLEGLVQVLQLEVDLLLGRLGVLDSLGLEGLDGLDLAVDIVGLGLEGLEALLDLVDDGLVLEEGAVLGKVDLGGQFGQLLDLALGVVIARLEGLQRGDRLAAEAQGGGHFDPVELQSCGSLAEGGGGEAEDVSSCVFPPWLRVFGSVSEQVGRATVVKGP